MNWSWRTMRSGCVPLRSVMVAVWVKPPGPPRPITQLEAASAAAGAAPIAAPANTAARARRRMPVVRVMR